MIDDNMILDSELARVNLQLQLLVEREGELRERRKALLDNQKILRAASKDRLTPLAKRALMLRLRPMSYNRIGLAMSVSTNYAQRLVKQAVMYIRRRKSVPLHHELKGDTWVASSCPRSSDGFSYYYSCYSKFHRPICMLNYGEELG